MSHHSQKALFLEGEGPDGKWVVRDRPVPKATPGHVVVKIHSTALNPVDWKIQVQGLFPGRPAIVGTDGAGTIEEVGEGVRQWKKGDKVFFQGYFEHDKATFQEYTRVPADIVSKIPDNISFEAASTIPVGLTAAVHGLYLYKGEDAIPAFTPPWLEGGEGKYAGTPTVIFGGSTSVGQYAVQFARLSGFSPIVVTASPHNFDLVKSLGATHLLDRSSSTISADILSALNNVRPSIIFDAVGEDGTPDTAWEILAPGGLLSAVLPLPKTVDKEKEPTKHFYNIFGSSHPAKYRDFSYVLYNQLPRLLAEGKIKPNPYEVLPGGLNAIGDGLKLMQEKKVSGKKLVVHPIET